MSDYLKRYEVTIETISPLYIGSGMVIKKKEYYFDRPNKEVYIFNLKKMLKGIMDKGLSRKYEDYMLNIRNQKDLNIFFRENNITKKDFINWVDYTIDTNGVDLQRKDINTFYKESGNRLSIPGSSLKGAIRTALLAYELRENNSRYTQESESLYRNARNFREKRGAVTRSAAEIEQKILRTLRRNKSNANNAVNDMMAGVKVSDSEIIPKTNLTLCQKIDLPVYGDETPYPIYCECIKPGTIIKTSITIDTSIQDKIDINRIKKAISNFSKYIYDDFGQLFGSNEYEEKDIFLGGSTGFVSKTVIYSLMNERNAKETTQNIMKNAFRKHEHENDIRDYDISPRMQKNTRYDGYLYEMGLVSIDFKEIK